MFYSTIHKIIFDYLERLHYRNRNIHSLHIITNNYIYLIHRNFYYKLEIYCCGVNNNNTYKIDLANMPGAKQFSYTDTNEYITTEIIKHIHKCDNISYVVKIIQTTINNQNTEENDYNYIRN
jgi:hypothetical protein